VYNVYFRHCEIRTKFYLAASDWSFWKIHTYNKPYTYLSNLHAELGIPFAPASFTAYSCAQALNLGDVVRIAPNHISFASTQALEEIYGYSTKCNKSEFYSNVARKSDMPPSIFSERFIGLVGVVLKRVGIKHGMGS
jgi:hypothetical protein